MKTISIRPASEAVIPFLRELLSNPAWVTDITIHDDDMQANGIPAADEQMPFLCSVNELNESLCRMEEEFFQGKTVGLTSAQMREKYAL